MPFLVNPYGYASTGPPAPLPGYSFRWIASSGLWQDLAKTTPAVADGDPVAVWTDEAGTHDLTNTAGTTRPLLKLNIINGHPVIRFDGSNDYLKYDFSGSPITRPYSTFWVGKVNAINDFEAMFQLASTAQLLQVDAFGRLTVFDGGSFGPRLTTPNTDPLIIFNGWDRTSPRMRFDDGVANTTGPINNMGNASIIVLSDDNALTHSSQTDIAEFIVYPSLLDTTDEGTERDILNGYYATF